MIGGEILTGAKLGPVGCGNSCQFILLSVPSTATTTMIDQMTKKHEKKASKQGNPNGKNDQLKVGIYDGLIDESCIKTMKSEIFVFLFLLITTTGLGDAVLNSERNIYYLDGVQVSLYYLFPFTLGAFLGAENIF